MKKQYRYGYKDRHNVDLQIFHDGELVDSCTLSFGEIGNKVDKLKGAGYTYGYLEKEVEDAKKEYEHRLKNLIRL